MSGQATGWVLRHGPKVRAMRSVLLTIADAANRDGEHAHPGVDAMVEGSLYGRATVFRMLDRLIADGWIEVEATGGGRGKATVYRVLGVTEKPSQDATVSETKGSHPDRETVSPASERVSPGSETVSPRSADLALCEPNGLTTDRSTIDSNGSARGAARVAWPIPAVVAESGFLPAALDLCELLAHQLAERGYAKEARDAGGKAGVLEMEALLRIDQRPVDHVRRMLEWLHTGNHEVAVFWRRNVRSAGSLRSRWVRILEEVAAHRQRRQRGENYGYTDRSEVDEVVARSRNGRRQAEAQLSIDATAKEG